MREWIKTNSKKVFWKSMALVIGIFAIIFIPLSIILVMDGEPEVAIMMFVIWAVIIVFILGITRLIMNRRIKKLVKAQEALGISFDFEIGEAEFLGDYGFLFDWFLYRNGQVMVFHKSYMADVVEGRVQNGKYTTPGIYIKTVDGKTYPLAVKKKYIPEVVSRIKSMIGIHPDEMLEGESSTVSELEQHMSSEYDKRDWKSLGIVLGVGAIAMVVFLGAYHVISSSLPEPTPEIIVALNENSEYVGVEKYTKYLQVFEKEVSYMDLNVYVDYAEEEGTYYVEIQNPAHYFINCTLRFSDEEGNTLEEFQIDMLRPHGQLVGLVDLAEYPSEYSIEEASYFELNYGNHEGYTILDDYEYDDERYYEWTNIIIDSEVFTMETVETALKRLYAECVVSDSWSNLAYIYNSATAETLEYGDYEYYLVNSAEYAAYVVLENKAIELYGLDEENNTVLLETWEME